jgi:hypothetical protein
MLKLARRRPSLAAHAPAFFDLPQSCSLGEVEHFLDASPDAVHEARG